MSEKPEGLPIRNIPQRPTPEFWKEWVTREAIPQVLQENFIGLLESGMDAYIDSFTYHALERGIQDFTLPIFSPTRDKDIETYTFDRKKNLIQVSIPWLLALASKKQDVPFTAWGLDEKGEANIELFYGTPKEDVYFGIVEEFDHAVFLHEDPKFRYRQEQSLLRHDAQTVELRALRTKEVFAKRKGLYILARIFRTNRAHAQAFFNAK